MAVKNVTQMEAENYCAYCACANHWIGSTQRFRDPQAQQHLLLRAVSTETFTW